MTAGNAAPESLFCMCGHTPHPDRTCFCSCDSFVEDREQLPLGMLMTAC